jgi:hypothetical protein
MFLKGFGLLVYVYEEYGIHRYTHVPARTQTFHGHNYALFTSHSGSFLLSSGLVIQEVFITVPSESELHRLRDRCIGLISEDCGKFDIHTLLLHLIC